MTLRIADIDFDRVDYDADGDVLCLAAGDPSALPTSTRRPRATLCASTPTARSSASRIVDARALIDQDGSIRITLPQMISAAEIAAALSSQRSHRHEVLALRRAQHERTPSSSTYRALRAAAEALDAWPLEQDAARATLQRADVRGFVDALLGDHELELA